MAQLTLCVEDAQHRHSKPDGEESVSLYSCEILAQTKPTQVTDTRSIAGEAGVAAQGPKRNSFAGGGACVRYLSQLVGCALRETGELHFVNYVS